MKKFLKIFLKVLFLAVVGVALYFYFGIWGNPVSKLLTRVSAQNYVEENYPHCHIENVGYNFKTGDYFANIQCETSIDTNFFVYTDWFGNITYDAYESYVSSGNNTVNRIMMEYRALLDEAMSQDSVNFTIDIYYGDYYTTLYYEKYGDENFIFGMPMDEIVLDKVYNHSDISYKYGHVCLYANDENVSVDRACEILLTVKDKLNEKNLGFYDIDFTLNKPRQEDGRPNEDNTVIHIDKFSYTDIYEEGLQERVQTAHDELTAYYAQMDQQKEQEFLASQK